MKRKQAAERREEGHLQRKRVRSSPPSIFDKLSEELCFHCLSYLGHADLLAVSESSTYLNRVASDNQLWKALYARQYLDQNEGDNAWFKRDDKSLPTRTWKGLFCIAHNWKVGRARTSQLSLRSSVLPQISLSTELDGPEDFDAEESAIAGPSSLSQDLIRQQSNSCEQHTKVVWHGQHYFVAGKEIQEGGSPSVEIFEITASSDAPRKLASLTSSGLKGKGAPGSLIITEMQLDAAEQEVEGIRLAVFYSNGQFSIFRIQGTGPGSQGTLHIQEEHFHSQTSSRSIIMARLHSPILVTSSSDCSVRFRLLEEVQDTASGLTRLRVTTAPPSMRTRLCFAPMTMRLTQKNIPTTGFARLKAQKSPQRFQLSLAYSTPYYPAAFTIGLQMFNITVPPRSKGSNMHHRHLEVFARTAIAVPPSSSVPGEQTQAMVNTIEHDGPYIVASRSDNTISVYRIIDSISESWLSHSDASDTIPLSPAKMHAIPLTLQHTRTLFGHTSAVDAVSLLDGRCVSTGRDGIKVWELPLERNANRSINAASESGDEDELRWKQNIPISERGLPDAVEQPTNNVAALQNKCRWIGLDNSRIVTVSQDDVAKERLIKVYHFE